MQPFLGRGFLEAEDLPDSDRVVVLGHDLWHRAFGADEAVLGRTIRLEQRERSIDYYYGEEIDVPEDEGQSVGFGFVQSIDAFATDIYLGLRNYDLDREGADLENIFAVLTGARIKF